MRSATLVRAALGGAVVCLIAVGVAAPALAGSADGTPCADGPLEALLGGGDCTGEEPGGEPPVLSPGSLLDPEFPDFPDFPGLADPDDGESDEGESDDGGDPDEQDDESDDSGESDETGGDSGGDSGSDDPADEPGDSGADEASGASSTGSGSDSGSEDTGAAGTRVSDDEGSGGSDGAAAGTGVRQARDAAAAAAETGAGVAVGSAVLPGVGNAVDGAGGTGLDWTGALAPDDPPARDEPHGPPAPDALSPVVDPLAAETPATAPPAGPPAQGRTADLAAVAFATALPAPVDGGWDLGAVLPSLALTLLLLAALALPAGMLNRAAAEHPDRVDALLARLRVPPGGRNTPVAFAAAVGVTALAGAVLLGFLSPAFPFDASAPALLVGLALAFVVVTAAQQGSQLLYVSLWWGVRCHVGPVPGFLLLGAVAVVLSRAVGLEPGLVLGTLVAFRTARPLRADEKGPAVALAATALTAVGAMAWALRDPLVAAAGAPGTFLPDVLATTLTAIAVGAAANLVFALVPVSFLPGAALLGWSPALWAVFACTGGFAFVHLVARPAADAPADRAGVLAVLLAVYLLGAAGLWTWLRHGVDLSTTRLTVVPRR